MLRCNGVSLNLLAEKFGISKDSIHRHFRKHVSPERRAELMAGPARVEQLANAAAEESHALIDYLSITRSVLFSQFLSCAEAGDRAGVAFIAGKLLDALREHGRVTGELRQPSGISITNNVMNISSSPSFLALQDGLLRIARAHPEARSEIVKLLRGLDASPEAKPQLIEAEAAHVAA
jgi:AcrR family transcriptional regulator